jgi:hypothetical protein
MPEKLGDVIGTMLSDIARARARADMEAIKIADAYSRDPLLKHMSVPRFRMPEIVVDLPVLISDVETPAGGGDPLSVAKPTKTELAKVVSDGLARSDLKLTKVQRDAATDAAVARAEVLFARDDKSLLSPGRVGDELALEVVGVVNAKLRKDPPAEQQQALSAATSAGMTELVASKLMPSAATKVMFKSEEIKAHGDSSNVIRLRLTISEDSYEVIDRDNGQGFLLSPE